MPELTFHHGGVSVPDLDESIEWYSRVLGFHLERRFRIEAAAADAAMVRSGDLRFELFEVAGAAALPEGRRHPVNDLLTHGNKHVAFQIDDLDAFLNEMAAKQADVALVVREAFGQGCFIRDCAGNLIEFVQKKTHDVRSA
ncbi:VOC family protein [Novosphingobium sp. BL-52-GroH]|uniref:VOC family protein n=1 Tax=Novosphingobium sp. BL-52-GroH TaxID=3349877 RepID=UPI00384E4722